MGQTQPASAPITISRPVTDTLSVMVQRGPILLILWGIPSAGSSAGSSSQSTSQGQKLSPTLHLSARIRWYEADCHDNLSSVRTRIGTHRARSSVFLELFFPQKYLATQDEDAPAEGLEPLIGHHLGETPSIVMPQLRALDIYLFTTLQRYCPLSRECQADHSIGPAIVAGRRMG